MESRSDSSPQTRALRHDTMRGCICKLIGVRNNHRTRFNEAWGRISKHSKDARAGSVPLAQVQGYYVCRVLSRSREGGSIKTMTDEPRWAEREGKRRCINQPDAEIQTRTILKDQSSSSMLCFCFKVANSSSRRASSAFAAAASCFAGI